MIDSTIISKFERLLDLYDRTEASKRPATVEYTYTSSGGPNGMRLEHTVTSSYPNYDVGWITVIRNALELKTYGTIYYEKCMRFANALYKELKKK